MNIEILEALKQLSEDALSNSVRNRRYGICFNLNEMLECGIEDDRAYDFVQHHCKTWSGFTEGLSCDILPIPRNGIEGRWEGKSLEKRLSLIDHLIGVLDE